MIAGLLAADMNGGLEWRANRFRLTTHSGRKLRASLRVVFHGLEHIFCHCAVQLIENSAKHCLAIVGFLLWSLWFQQTTTVTAVAARWQLASGDAAVRAYARWIEFKTGWGNPVHSAPFATLAGDVAKTLLKPLVIKCRDSWVTCVEDAICCRDCAIQMAAGAFVLLYLIIKDEATRP
jgi:hypothetical protein